MSRSEKLFTRGGQEVTRAQYEAIKRAQAKRVEDRQAKRKQQRGDRKRACVHLGKRVGGADVYSPRGVDCCTTLACAIYGQCTIKRKVAGIAYCKDCERYEARAKKTPVARPRKPR